MGALVLVGALGCGFFLNSIVTFPFVTAPERFAPSDEVQNNVTAGDSTSEPSTWVDFPMPRRHEIVSLQTHVGLYVTNATYYQAQASSYNRVGNVIAGVDVALVASAAAYYFLLPAAAPAAASAAAASPAAAAPAAASPAAAGPLLPFVPSAVTTAVTYASVGGGVGMGGVMFWHFLTLQTWQWVVYGFAYVGVMESANAALQSAMELADSAKYYVLPNNWWRDAARFKAAFVALKSELNTMFNDWKARSIVTFALDVYAATRVACDTEKKRLSYQCALAMRKSMTVNCAERICVVPKGPADKRIEVYAEELRLELDDAKLLEIRGLQAKMRALRAFESARRAIRVACDVPHADDLIAECESIRTDLKRVPIRYFESATKAIDCVYQTQNEESFHACFFSKLAAVSGA